MCERLSEYYEKKSTLSVTAWVCPQVATAVVEPFTTDSCFHGTCAHRSDRDDGHEALYDILTRVPHSVDFSRNLASVFLQVWDC